MSPDVELPGPPVPPGEVAPHGPGIVEGVKRVIIGAPRDLQDPHVFHKLSLMAFLAWVGLGADGLSSSSYGPDEAFRALAGHEYIAVFIAVMIAITVGVISFCYTFVVEHFPSGGGGYVVASQLLGPVAGVVSGSALVVDYVLTITVSICSGVDAILSFLPLAWHVYKVPLDLAVLLLLLTLNLRGIKESIKILLPIFMVFVVTHLVLVGYGILAHASAMPQVLHQTRASLQADVGKMGFLAVLLLFLRSYSLGAGTYTGIEAVSNGVQILKEPRVATAKRTMVYMALSLTFTAGGIIFCYLLWNASPVEGKTMNAVLLERVFASWALGGWQVGAWIVILTLLSEGALLFVAAQTGFIDGPRVMSNMAVDSWLPRRFASLSDRLTTANGVMIMGAAALIVLVATHGNIDALVVMYAINVFVTFSLSQVGMARFSWQKHRRGEHWKRAFSLHVVALVLCLAILSFTVVQKFEQGAWVTLLVTAAIVTLCFVINLHYRRVARQLRRLDQELGDLGLLAAGVGGEPDPKEPTAVLMVGGYGGIGIHSLLSIQRFYPGYYKNVIFVSVAVLDSGTFKGSDEIGRLEAQVRQSLDQYVNLARGLGWRATSRMASGLDAVKEATAICTALAEEFPRCSFFAGKLIWKRETWWQTILHNETAYQIQRRLHWKGLPMAVLPIRVGMGAENRAAPIRAG